MSKPKKKYEQDYFASIDQKDYFAKFYEGMAKSKAYINLSLSAKYIYLLCRVHQCSTEGRRVLYKHAEAEGRKYPSNAFVFPSSHFKLYGVDRSNASKVLKELVTAGFIDLIEQNAHRHKPNVYAFSRRWKDENMTEKQENDTS